jgi:arylsulfatase A-like enzyme
VACADGDRGGASAPAALPRQIVLVTIDTLRADHLGAYGYRRATSPTIDDLARAGVQVMRAYAPMARTVPAHMSMLTGLAPRSHGALHNHASIARSDIETLPGRLVRRGHATAAFVSVPFLDPRAKRLQGFTHVESPPVGGDWPAPQTAARAAAWIEAHAERSFFVWLHLFDPHRPYAPPPPYDRMFQEGPAAPYEAPLTGRLVAAPPTAHQAAFVRALYDGEIRYTDDAVGALVRRLEALPAPPLVIVTADHGEVLEEHAAEMRIAYSHGQWPAHQVLAVPLIFHWPGHLAPGRVATPVDITGLASTILDVLYGESLTGDGASFAGLLRGEAAKPAPLFAWTMAIGDHTSVDPAGLAPGWEFRLHETLSVLRWPWHLIHNPVRGTALYDVERDPLELADVAAAHPDRTAVLRRELLQHFAAPASAGGVVVDGALREQLRHLGYE